MLLPKRMSKTASAIVYPAVCCLHGLLYGVLYAPTQALFFGLSFKSTIAWIVAGFPFDLIHGIGNLFAGMLILPLSVLLKKAIKAQNR
jgi:energy-coupling factor transport system substrate-specific component